MTQRYRNVLAVVPCGRTVVAVMVKATHRHEDHPAARNEATVMAQTLEGDEAWPGRSGHAAGCAGNVSGPVLPAGAPNTYLHECRAGGDRAVGSPTDPASGALPRWAAGNDSPSHTDDTCDGHARPHATVPGDGMISQTRSGGRGSENLTIVMTRAGSPRRK